MRVRVQLHAWGIIGLAARCAAFLRLCAKPHGDVRECGAWLSDVVADCSRGSLPVCSCDSTSCTKSPERHCVTGRQTAATGGRSQSRG